MQDWFANFGGGQVATAIFWTIAALVLLVVALVVVRMLRGGSRFAGHGRDRRQRLSLGDSIAIDNQRRLVLVRRDDVEHLILTGGPSDLVVEQNIRPGAQPRPRSVEAPMAQPAAPAPAPVAPPDPAPAPVVAAAAPRPEPVEATARPGAVPPLSEVRPAPAAARPHPVAPVYRPQPSVATVAARSSAEDAVLEEMGADMGPGVAAQAPSRSHNATLEDEMSRLLEDISDERR